MNERTRATIYRVIVAAVPLATAYGLVDDSTAGKWVMFAGALLGTGSAGLAAKHTSRAK